MAPSDNNLIETEQVDSESPDTVNNEETTRDESSRPASGRGLALFSTLLALISLAVSGWVYYRVVFVKDESAAIKPASQAELANLDKQLKSLSDQQQNITAQQQQLIQTTEQLNQQLQQKLAQPADKGPDLSPLTNDIASLRRQLRTLEAKMQQAPIEPDAEPYLQALARAQAVQALKSVQLLLDQKQMDAAVNILKQWRNHPQLPLAVQTRLQQLVTTLSNLVQPETSAMHKQLANLKNQINGLTLATEEIAQTEPTWYDKFITVKKIHNQNGAFNSADLQQLKANAQQQLNQAELAMVLQQPENWQSSLSQTAQLLSDSALKTTQIEQQLNKLSNQAIVITLPNNLGIESLIAQIEGITE